MELLSQTEINTLIAACLLCQVKYTTLKDKVEAKRYSDLEYKLRNNCYDKKESLAFIKK